MSEHKIIAVLYAHYNPTLKGLEFKLTDNQYWVGDTDVVINKEFEVTAEIADLDQAEYTRLAINTLKDKQTKAWADASKKVAGLEEKIKELQLLTWQSDVLKEGDFQLKPEGSTAELYEEPSFIEEPASVLMYGNAAHGTSTYVGDLNREDCLIIDSLSAAIALNTEGSFAEMEERISEREYWKHEGPVSVRLYGAPINVEEISRGVLDELFVPDGEAVLVDIVDGEVVDLDAIQQTELDIAEGEWEAYSEEEKQTISDLNNFDGQGL